MWCSYLTLFDERTGNSCVIMTQYTGVLADGVHILENLVEDENMPWVAHNTTNKEFIEYLENVKQPNVFRLVHRAGQRGHYKKWFFVKIIWKNIGKNNFDDGYSAQNRYYVRFEKLNNLEVIDRMET